MSITLPKIFLDSGDPEETRKAKGLLGKLDGQTTNPSLVIKHPELQKFLQKGKKLQPAELLNFYRQIVAEINKQLAGPISVEVYADWETSAKDMLKQAEQMANWGKNIYIKFPTINEGLAAAHDFVGQGGKVNMTLVFDQLQAAAVYVATQKSKSPAFISPFIGRWDDRGYNGLDLVKNIIKQYKKYTKHLHKPKSHVEVLGASIRNLNHFYSCIFLSADIVTIPLKIIYNWIEQEKWIPDEHYREEQAGLQSLIYQDIPLKPDFKAYNIRQKPASLLDEGIKKFVKDWNALLS